MRFNRFLYPNWVIALMATTLYLLTTHVFAQEDNSEQKGVEQAQKPQSRAVTKAPITDRNGVIQLEAVIRGNQQQPKVLTIVPWQSPGRKNTLPSPVWQQVKQQLQPLERRDFLQEQRLFEKLLNK